MTAKQTDAKKENLYINPLLLCLFAVKIPNVKGVQCTSD
jgi:hypothetical protein